MISHPWSCCLLGPCWSICSSIAVISCPMGSIGPDDRVGVCCQASLAFPSCSSSHLCKQEIRMTAWHGQGKNRSVSYSQCLDRCAELKKWMPRGPSSMLLRKNKIALGVACCPMLPLNPTVVVVAGTGIIFFVLNRYWCVMGVPASLRATPNASLQATSRNHTLLTLWTLTLGNTDFITLGNTDNIVLII